MVSRWLSERLESGPVHLGQLTIAKGDGSFKIAGPGATTNTDEANKQVVLDCNPDTLREWVRFDDRGRYRPLNGAKTMRAGWRVECRSIDDLSRCLEAVYPLALRHLELWQGGRLEITPIDRVLDRQTGRYRKARDLSDAGRALASDILCEICVKAPLWRGAEPAAGQIPCPEPCSVLVALCREAAIWEEDRPEPAAPDPQAAFADFEAPGNAVREAYLKRKRSPTPDC